MKYITAKHLVLFTAIIVITSCSKKAEDLQAPKFDSVNTDNVSLTLIKDSVIADGTTNAEFLIKVNSSVVKTYKEVVLSVSPIGKFPDGSTSLNTTIDASGEAKIFINSFAKGISTVKADITNLCSKSASVHFITSFPEQILMQPAVNTMPSSLTSSASITAKLIRSNGSVSNGFYVNFYDSTTTNLSVGVFLNTTASNNSSECTTTYSIQDTSYHGLVYIKGYIMTNTGKITGFNKILIQ